jgi:hypothetical protein
VSASLPLEKPVSEAFSLGYSLTHESEMLIPCSVVRII